MSRYFIPALAGCLAFAFAPYEASAAESIAKDASQYLSARIAEERGETKSAISYLNKIRKRHPHSIRILEQLLPLEVSAGYMRSAVLDARRLSRYKPDHQFAQLILAIDFIKKKRYAEALERFSSQEANNLALWPGAPVLGAWAAYGDKKIGTAQNILRQGARANHFHRLHAALINAAAGRTQEAAQGLLFMEKIPIKTRRSSVLYANFMERNDRPEDALAIYKAIKNAEVFEAPRAFRAIQRLRDKKSREDPPPLFVRTPQQGAAEYLYSFALFSHENGSTDSAIFYLQLALYLNPRFDSAWMRLGAMLEKQERFKDAISVYRNILNSSPFSTRSRIRVALAREKMGEEKRAISLLSNIAKNNPQYDQPLAALGDLYVQRRDFPNAVKAYDRAIILNQKMGEKWDIRDGKINWRLLFARGISYERQKKWNEAESDLQRAVQLSNEDPLVLNYLGYSWVDREENLDEALAMLQKAARKSPHNGYIIDSLGWAFYRLGQYDEALEHLERAARMEPAETEINDHLGDVLWRLGRRIEARFQWRHALENSKSDDNVSEERVAEIERKLRQGMGGGRVAVGRNAGS